MHIKIYNGLGVSKESLKQTFLMLLDYAPRKYHVSYVSSEEIIEGRWIKETKLIVFPGGADIYYKQYLDGVGNKQIQKFLSEGGSFLGICAGAYYSGSYIEFAKSSSIEVIGERELSIYKNSVIGPALCKYYYNSYKGTKAVKIIPNVKGLYKDLCLFYNGGGYFLDAENMSGVKIIGNYQDSRAAIIECIYGKGKAILSGVHFEYNPYLMKPSKILTPIINSLKEYNESRISLVQSILNRLLDNIIYN
jgi:glutamine amidotransferase-like uncharacterized protein